MFKVMRKILNGVLVGSILFSSAAAKPATEKSKAKLTKVLVAAAVNVSLIASNPFFAELEGWRSVHVDDAKQLEETSKIV